MIIELAIGAGVLLASAVAVRVVRKRRAGRDSKPPEPTPPPEPKATGPRGFLPGDVLLYADSELWLAGMLSLDEEGFVCRIFRTPGSRHASWVGQLDEAAQDIVLLSESDDIPEGVVPESLPIDGIRVSVRRRGDADVKQDGEQLPAGLGERARYVILRGPGGRTAIVLDFAHERIALAGERVDLAMVDHLPGGDAA